MATSINLGRQRRHQPQLPPDSEIIEACDRNPPCDENEYRVSGLMYPPQAPVFWIKYGLQQEGRDAEARTQDWAFRALEQIPQSDRYGIRIPEVYRVFIDERYPREPIVYIVMEYIPGKTLSQIDRDTPINISLEPLYERIAKAIELFLSFEVPDNATPGPYGGGIIRHPLFKDYKAAIEYSSLEQLQYHINKVSTMIRGDQPTVDFSQDKLYFCFSDLFSGNFLFSDDGSLYILDFEQASFLPISFMTYALTIPREVCNTIKAKLDLPQRNLPGLMAAGSLFIMATPTIGLPLYEEGSRIQTRLTRYIHCESSFNPPDMPCNSTTVGPALRLSEAHEYSAPRSCDSVVHCELHSPLYCLLQMWLK